MKTIEFATRLGWTEKAVAPRLRALGLLDCCSRCGGGGHYSYCQRYGTTCFKCSGFGKQLPKFTVKLVKLVAELVAAGALVPYFERNARIAAAKKRLPGVIAEAKAAYMVIGSMYEAAYKTRSISPELHALQHENNRLHTGMLGSESNTHPIRFGVWDFERAALKGEMDAETAEAFIRVRIEEIKALSAKAAELAA